MANQVITKQELIDAQKDVKHAGEAVNTKKVITPRYGEPFKSLPLTIEDLNIKANEVIAQGFYKGFATEALLLAAKPTVSEMRARADDTRKIWRWNRTSGEGVVPVTGTWTDTGPSDVDVAVEQFIEEAQRQGVALDQLEEYCNYLMQRLAQIAVDKGWEASFVVDGDKTQKQINEEQKVINTKNSNYIIFLNDYIFDGETDIKNALRRVRVHMILVGGGTVKAKADKEYTFTVNSEADTFDFPKNTILDFQGAKLHIGHNQNGPDYLLYFKSAVKNAGLVNADPVWHGTFISNQDQVTKYGVSAFRCSFNAMVGLFGNYNGFKLHNVNPSGSTDANYYDALIRSFTGSGKGADIADINASHYSNLISDGYAGAKIRRIRGTKRSNASNAVYGPSHLAYVGLTDNSVIDDVYEYGTVLGDPVAYTGATIQTTALLKGSKILNVTATMQNAASVVMKGISDDTVIVDNITCAPEAWTMPIAASEYLFGNLTNIQNTFVGGNISNIYIDTKNFDVTGAWAGGSNVNWSNVNVVSNATAQKTMPLANIVTTESAKLNITIKEKSKSFASIPALIRAFTDSELTLNLDGNLSDINATAHPVSGSYWTANSNNTITVNNINKSSKINWRDEAERNSSKVNNPLRFEKSVAGVNTVDINIPLDPPRYSVSNTTNPTLIAYEIAVSVIDTVQKNHSYFGVFRVVLSSGSSVTNQKNVQMIGTEAKFGDAITMTAVVSADNTSVTFTATRGSGNYLGRIVADVKQILKI